MENNGLDSCLTPYKSFMIYNFSVDLNVKGKIIKHLGQKHSKYLHDDRASLSKDIK